MKLVENKSGSRVEWALRMTEVEKAAAGARSLDCAEVFAIPNDSASLGVTNGCVDARSVRSQRCSRNRG